MTESDGREVLLEALDVARQMLGVNLSAAYALGSLAHGGFAPLVSDVDLALVVDRIDPQTPSRINRIGDTVLIRHASPLAGRLSVFWSDWNGVHHGADGAGRLPELDRLDLLESGSLLYGTDERGGARLPDHDDLVREAAEFTLAKFDDAYREHLAEPATLLAAGLRPVTKAVLFPVRFGYTLHTGRIGRNHDAAAWYSGAGRELVEAAIRWRTDGIDDEADALQLLESGLIPLYRQFVAEYDAGLRAIEQPGLAAELTAWGSGLR